jgi:DNA invertase Pin-like site-specific DNA recombinase
MEIETIAYLYCEPCLELLDGLEFWQGKIDRVYRDLGGRLEWQRLEQDCQLHPPQRLLLRSLTELGDSLLEIGERLQALEALNIEVIASKQDYRSSFFTLLDPERLKVNLALLFQEIQHDLQQQKLQKGHARNRLKILPPPGRAPYGYRRGRDRYILDRSTAPVVKAFFDRFLLFGSLRGAVNFLEKRYGKKISVSTGKNWLTNPVYRGNLIYQKKTVISDTHAAIISAEEAAQIDRLLRRNSRFSRRAASAPRSLAGLVFCGQCQSAMTIVQVTQRGKTQEYLYLRPRCCPLQTKCSAIAYQDILEKTIEQICLDLPQAIATLNTPNVYSLQQKLLLEIRQKKEILQEIERLKNTLILDEDTASLRSYQLRQEIATIESQIAALPPVNLTTIAKTVSLRQFWLDLSETERRFYFREFLSQIYLDRSNQQSWQLKLVFIF